MKKLLVPVLALLGLVATACGSGGTDAGDQSPAAAEPSTVESGASVTASAGPSADDAASELDPASLGVDTLNLDYAYYNPASLVLRQQGWIEEALGDEVAVTWTLSAGSNKANEALRGSAVDFASTAGAAAMVARANGAPNKVVAVLGLPEWSAIVVPSGSDIATAADLEGKKIAATTGTDPYFFLLQTLADAGLSLADVEVVNLQHADGRTALVRGDVDAWAGLDPIMADAEITDGATLVARDPSKLSYSVLNVREDYLADHPEAVEFVLSQYERARQWIADNPDEAAALLASESGVELEVAQTVLNERTDLTVDPIPGEDVTAVLDKVAPIVVSEAQVPDEATAGTAIDSLLAPEAVTAVLAAQG